MGEIQILDITLLTEAGKSIALLVNYERNNKSLRKKNVEESLVYNIFDIYKYNFPVFYT